MSSHVYAYVVSKSQGRPLRFELNGQLFHSGDAIRDVDAIALELPENAHLLSQCARVMDEAFKHHDALAEEAESTPSLPSVPEPSNVVSFPAKSVAALEPTKTAGE